MSERYNRPRTPPGPPPSSSSRKSSVRGPSTSAASSKSLTSKSYVDRAYEKYGKGYKSSSFQSSKPYPDDKYKSSSKVNDKVTSSKYVSKSVYIDDGFKLGTDSQYSSQRYSDAKDTYNSSKYSEKGRYTSDSKYSLTNTTPVASQYSGKKYDDYGTYQDKASRYPKQENSGSYYGGSYDTYGSYDGYGADRQQRSGAYNSDGLPLGTSGYGGDKFGGGRSNLGGGYAGDKVSSSNLGYGSEKQSRGGSSSYGGEKHNRSGRGVGYGGGGDKHATGALSYSDTKPAATTRSRLYGGGEEDRRVYRSYSPARTARSPVRGGGYSGSYDDYGYASSSRGGEKQYLDRYVIGNSVVYGPPGQYPRNVQPPSSPGQRPPSPPSPPLLIAPRSYNSNRYSAAGAATAAATTTTTTTTSPRRYSSGMRSLTPTASSAAYQTMSPAPRRPPSPPSSRRPPSPDSLYMRGRDRSYDTNRSKERYNNNKTRISRSPLRDNRSLTDRRDHDRTRLDDRSGRRDADRRLGSREKSSNNLDANKRGRVGEQRSSNYRGGGGGGGDTRSWGAKDSYSNNKDNRNTHTSPARNPRRDTRTADSGTRDRGRRLEDRLGINPGSNSRRSPVARPRIGRNAASPRDGNNKKPRRPDDLRLWIESRKNEGGKKGLSQSRPRPLGKGIARPVGGDRSKMIKRSRLGDPKRRLGVKARRTGGPLRRNKILNKYRRLTAKRGMRSGGGSGGGGGSTGGARYSNRSNREGGGGGGGGSSSKGELGCGDHGEDMENSKPGSTASIRRVIKKPKRVSQVNNLEIKPRVMGKTVKKLLKDPKEEEGGSSSRVRRRREIFL